MDAERGSFAQKKKRGSCANFHGQEREGRILTVRKGASDFLYKGGPCEASKRKDQGPGAALKKNGGTWPMQEKEGGGRDAADKKGTKGACETQGDKKTVGPRGGALWEGGCSQRAALRLLKNGGGKERRCCREGEEGRMGLRKAVERMRMGSRGKGSRPLLLGGGEPCEECSWGERVVRGISQCSTLLTALSLLETLLKKSGSRCSCFSWFWGYGREENLSGESEGGLEKRTPRESLGVKVALGKRRGGVQNSGARFAGVVPKTPP